MGILYDRGLHGGQGQIQGPGGQPVNIPLDGSPFHVTQFDPQTNIRWSWDTNGFDPNAQQVLHPTNQNYPPGHPHRHIP